MVVDKNDPDNYPTLIRYLEATGRIKHAPQAQMLKAKYLYLRGNNVKSISEQTGIEPSIIDRWALCFSWDEERDRRQFEQFRKVSGIAKLYGDDITIRHDRIAGGIEQAAERMLQQHSEGKITLAPRDLATLSTCVKNTQEIRRTSRGETAKKSESNVHIQIGVPGNLERLAGALVDAYDRPRLIQAKTRTIAVGTENEIGSDTEYEKSADRNSEESREENSAD